jgi:hypothetical protein
MEIDREVAISYTTSEDVAAAVAPAWATLPLAPASFLCQADLPLMIPDPEGTEQIFRHDELVGYHPTLNKPGVKGAWHPGKVRVRRADW